MKNATKPATSKLVARFDEDLKNLLMGDLKAFKAKSQFRNCNHQSAPQKAA